VIDYGLARSIRAKPVYSPRTAYTSMGVAVIADRGRRSQRWGQISTFDMQSIP
jgi:hypothetical protein